MERNRIKLNESDRSSDDDDESDSDSRDSANAAVAPRPKIEQAKREHEESIPMNFTAANPIWERVVKRIAGEDKDEEDDNDSEEDVDQEEAVDLATEAGPDAPIDELDHDESVQVTTEIVVQRVKEVGDEITSLEPESTEAKQATAAEYFLQVIDTRLHEATDDDLQQLADTAAHETIEAFAPDVLAEYDRPVVDGTPDVITPELTEPHPETPLVAPGYMEYEDQSIRNAVRLPTETETGDASGGNSGSGNANRFNQFGSTGGPTSVSGAHAAPGEARPGTISRHEAEANEASARFGGAVVGGIIGYLIGKRRGRIKSEKRLLPIQKRLEEQVRTIQTNLAAKEAQVRYLVHRQSEVTKLPFDTRREVPVLVEPKPAVLASDRIPQMNPIDDKIPLSQRVEVSHRPLEAIPDIQPAKAYKEAVANRTPAPTTERLGLLTLKAVETAPRQNQKKETLPFNTANVEVMSREELLEVGDKIVVGAASLRRVYETNLISEHGLRRLVKEHARGGDVRKALREELLIKELSFERDPQMRDMRSRSGDAARGIKQPAEQPSSVPSPAGTILSGSASHMIGMPDELPPPRPHPARPFLVAANTTALVVLAVLLVLLLIIRLSGGI